MVTLIRAFYSTSFKFMVLIRATKKREDKKTIVAFSIAGMYSATETEREQLLCDL